jgi:phospholipase/carboxylesterase
MTNFLPHVEIESGPNPTAAVIWLHGLGADGNDFATVVPQLQLTGDAKQESKTDAGIS